EAGRGEGTALDRVPVDQHRHLRLSGGCGGAGRGGRSARRTGQRGRRAGGGVLLLLLAAATGAVRRAARMRWLCRPAAALLLALGGTAFAGGPPHLHGHARLYIGVEGN